MVATSPYRPDSAHGFLQQPYDGAEWRAPALDQLKERGIPTPILERWKYTNLLAFEKSGAAPAEKVKFQGDVVRLPWMRQNSRKLIFVNGHLILGDAKLTLGGQGINHRLDSTPMDDFDDGMLWALNTAFCADGPSLTIDESCNGQTFEIIHVAQGADAPLLSSPRSVIELLPNMQATIIEQWIGTGTGVVHTNHAWQIGVAAGASLKHIRLQNDRIDRAMLSSTHVRLGRDANYNNVFLSAGAATSRQEFWIELHEQGANATVHGAQLMTGKQVMDTTILIEHQAPHCTSNQTIRNVLDGQARGVFQGKVHVHQPAQKTDGYQLCNSIMLSPTAEMNTKPELEIYADDVKCSHGTTTGRLDENALFYMQSRGIPAIEARKLLLAAFVGAVFDGVEEDIQTVMQNQAEGWLQA
ncbi:MAG TPA: Fe-S cluster assembly protein SufD [Alphaproteobacteria bacterium]